MGHRSNLKNKVAECKTFRLPHEKQNAIPGLTIREIIISNTAFNQEASALPYIIDSVYVTRSESEWVPECGMKTVLNVKICLHLGLVIHKTDRPIEGTFGREAKLIKSSIFNTI